MPRYRVSFRREMNPDRGELIVAAVNEKDAWEVARDNRLNPAVKWTEGDVVREIYVNEIVELKPEDILEELINEITAYDDRMSVLERPPTGEDYNTLFGIMRQWAERAGLLG